MKITTIFLIFIFFSQVAFTQSRGGFGSSTSLTLDPLMTFSGPLTKPATKTLDNFKLELLPGEKLDDWYYFCQLPIQSQVIKKIILTLK